MQDKGVGTKRRLPAAAKEVESLTELLATSDIVSLHCAASRDTVQLINGEALHSMKPGTLTWLLVSHICACWGLKPLLLVVSIFDAIKLRRDQCLHLRCFRVAHSKVIRRAFLC